MELIIKLGIFLFLLGLGFFVGTASEKRHLLALAQREALNRDFLIVQTPWYDLNVPSEPAPMLVIGEVVIATDYLKSFLARLRKIFGGELRSYQSLLVRARREALQRVVEEARGLGYDAICNLRYETADVGGNTSAKRVATVAILASATAFRRAPPVSTAP